MNLYCPPNYSLDLLTKAFSEFAEVSSPLALVGGDFLIVYLILDLIDIPHEILLCQTRLRPSC